MTGGLDILGLRRYLGSLETLREGSLQERRESAVLTGVAVLSVPVAVLLFVAEPGIAVSNAGQTVSALVSALIAATWFSRPPHRTVYALAALGCAGWALSNLLWYAASVATGADLVPGVADAGFIGFFFFITGMSAVSAGRASGGITASLPTLVILAGTVVLVPAAAYLGNPVFYIGLYLLPAAACTVIAARSFERAPVWAVGTVLYCLAMVGNSFREACSLSMTASFLNGPVVMAAFPLIVLGASSLLPGRPE